MQQRPSIALIASGGGHLQQLLQLRELIARIPHCYIVEKRDGQNMPDELTGRTYFVRCAARNLGNLVQPIQFLFLLRRLRPACIISTGASVACSAALAARLLGIPVLYIESFSAVTRPTLTGRIMYHLSYHMIYQWEELSAIFPKAEYGGFLYDFGGGRD